MQNIKRVAKWLVTPQPQTPLSLSVNIGMAVVGMGMIAYSYYADYKMIQQEKKLSEQCK